MNRSDDTVLPEKCFSCCRKRGETGLKPFFYAVGYYAHRIGPSRRILTYTMKESVTDLGKDVVAYCPDCLEKIRKFYILELLKRAGILFACTIPGIALIAIGAKEEMEWMNIIGVIILLIFSILATISIIHIFNQYHPIDLHVMKKQDIYKKRLSDCLKEQNSIIINSEFRSGVKLHPLSNYRVYENFNISLTDIKSWYSFPKYIKWDKLEV